MKLRSTILVVVAGTFVLLVVAVYGVTQLVLLPGIVKSERQEVTEDVERMVSVLGAENDFVDATAHDWAAWDDTYSFMEDGNGQYIDANVVDSVLSRQWLNNGVGRFPYGQEHVMQLSHWQATYETLQ